MYYHVTVMTYKGKESGEFDLTESDAIKLYCKPYIDNKVIVFDDGGYSKSELKYFEVYSSEISSDEVFATNPNKDWIVSKIDAINDEKLTKRITKEITSKTYRILESEKQQTSNITQNVTVKGNANNNVIAGQIQNSTVSPVGTFYLENTDKSRLENTLNKLEKELQQQQITNEELTSAIATLRAALTPEKPNTKIISFALDALKTTIQTLISTTAVQVVLQQLHV